MEQQPQLKDHTIWLMIGTAFLFDVLQALLDLIGVGWLLVPVAYGTFILWFLEYDISPFALLKKRKAAIGAGFALELITAGIMPSTTYTVARIALDYKAKRTKEGKVVGDISPTPRDSREDVDIAA